MPSIALPGMNESVAIALIAIGLAIVVWAGRALWTFAKPHLDKRWDAANAERASVAKLFNALSDSEPQKVEVLRDIKDSLGELKKRQVDHAKECKDHTELLKGIAAKVT
jgi:hypothetical protein